MSFASFTYQRDIPENGMPPATDLKTLPRPFACR